MHQARSRTAAQLTGDSAEDLVARRLAAGGWTILGRNVRAGRAELDIVAIDPGPPRELVVVEVRYRARRDFGLAEETVDFRKRSTLRAGLHKLRVSGQLAGATSVPRLPARFDLIVVEPARELESPPRIRHYTAAF